MKTRYLAVLVLFAAILSSCKEADDFQDVLYFTGTEKSPAMKIAVEGPTSYALSVTASCKTETDVRAHLKCAPELVEQYNEQNNTLYKPLPTGSYNLSSEELVIPAGKFVSDKTMFNITSTDAFKEGVSYCMPIRIEHAEGGLPVLETSRIAYVVVNKTIITYALDLKKVVSFNVTAFQEKEALKAVPKVTMEGRIFMNSFAQFKPFISSVMGIEENFMLRFGDVTIDKSQLQLAGGGRETTVAEQFALKKWYHVAVVYDGSSAKIYVNGELSTTKNGLSGPIDLTDAYSGGFHIGFSAGGRKLDGAVSEMRVWTKALSKMEIENNMCIVNVDAKDPDLLAYWRFNEGQGVDIKDWSGNGYDLKYTGTSTLSWISGVRCPDVED